MRYQIPPGGPQGSPLTRFLGAIVGVFIMVGLFFVGITVFAAAAGIALIAFLVFYARFWWLTRKSRRRFQEGEESAAHQPGHGRPDPQSPRQDRDRRGVTLDGEYEERD